MKALLECSSSRSLLFVAIVLLPFASPVGFAASSLALAGRAYLPIAGPSGNSGHPSSQPGSSSARVQTAAASPPPSRNIYTFAGNGQFGDTGNGGPALDAEFEAPDSITSDLSGNIYIADPQSHVVRRVDHATGIITAFAGNGMPGDGGADGDGGPALQAEFYQMQGIASDLDGNIYICDLYRVRRVNAKTGIITNVAGTGTGGYTTGPGIATNVELAFPFAVATDLIGDFFVADVANDVIWKIDAQTSYMHVIAGTGFSGFSGDGGPATEARLQTPYGLAIDAAGDIYIGDSDNNRIRRVDAVTGIITTVAGNGTAGYFGDGGLATDAGMLGPNGLVIDANGNFYFSDNTYRVREVEAATGNIYTVAGDGAYAYGGDGGPATSAEIGANDLLTLDSAGNLYLSDTPPNSIRVRIVGAKPNGSPIATTTSLIASATTLGAGQALTLTATVTAASGGSPTGKVTFTNGSTVLGSAALDSRGTAQLAITPQAGTYLVKAGYGGSADDYASNSTTVAITVNGDPTTTSLSSSSTALTVGQTLTLTATVIAQAGQVPAGAVSFLNGSAVIGTAMLNGAGVANLNLTPAVGKYGITASYGGSSSDLASSSAPPLVLDVTASPSNTSVSASQNPAPFGNEVSFTATVSATQEPATGMVVFYDGTTAIGTSTLSSGNAKLSTISLAVGTHRITAAYLGSVGVLASTSSPLIETITSADFSLVVSPASRTIYTGEAASFTVTVHPQPGFALDVSLACEQLPANTSCSFSPSSIAGGSGTAGLIIRTTAPSDSSAASLRMDKVPTRIARLKGIAGLTLISLSFGWPLRRRFRGRPVLLPVLFIASLISCAFFTGCGGPSALVAGTPAGTFSIQVIAKATNGAQTLVHSSSVELKVKSLF